MLHVVAFAARSAHICLVKASGALARTLYYFSCRLLPCIFWNEVAWFGLGAEVALLALEASLRAGKALIRDTVKVVPNMALHADGSVAGVAVSAVVAYITL